MLTFQRVNNLISRHKKLVFLLAIVGALVSIPLSIVNADAIITVDSSADNTTAGDGFCTLREAITNANNDSDSTSGDCVAGSGTDTIEFDITSNEGAGPHTITIASSLTISQSVIIDGTTETGYVANNASAPNPINGSKMIEITGGGASIVGFHFGGTSTLRGVVINDFDGTSAIFAANSGVTTFEGNYIGTDISGTASGSNGGFGIVLNSGGTVIGGTDPEDRNIFSAIGGAEAIHGNGNAGTNTILGNYIGLAKDGVTALGNAGHGISMYTAGPSLVVGNGTTDGSNVISGNGSLGINYNTDGTSTIAGNLIGTDYTGTVDVGNTHSGIATYELADNLTIGGDTAGERNIISGNNTHGIDIGADTASGGVTVIGNYIGVTSGGTTALPNSSDGISILSDSHTIGGDTAGERNIISGNGANGITLSTNSNDNIIQGNYIGVGSDGTTDVGNTGVGISISNGSYSNLIGGTTASVANIIKRNDDNGVVVTNDASDNNAIIGNTISRNVDPNIDLGNDGSNANDAGDADTGANDGLNYPVWISVTEIGGNTDAEYSLDVPAGDYRVETFSGNGETLIDTQNITHTGSGSEDFTNTITGDGYNGLRMSVTEIDAGESSGFGSTSEYSDAYSSGSATITVNSTEDDEDDDGECTLREAITAANNDVESGEMDGECVAGAATDTIEFDIAGAGPHAIQPTSGLPWISSDNITIDGYSETGATANATTTSACFDGVIKIELDGSGAGSANGLIVAGDNVSVKGLAINNFSDNGITINGGSGSVISGNLIGTNTAGLVDAGNGDAGVGINNGDNITIGGNNPEDRNLISGNEGFGGVSIYTDTSTVIVSGNCIGLDATGDSALPNNHHGFNIYQAGGDITIGGTTSGSRNIISGNDEQGISLDESSVDLIAGNYIGTNVDGSADLGNGTQGIWVDSDASVDLIGGTTAAARNVISGNTSSGITISGGSSTIKGNYIGTNASGSSDLGNTLQGIFLESDNNTIGGPNTSDRNVISGNNSNGIAVNAGSDSNTIQNNYIGLSSDGLNSVQNCASVNSPNIGISSNNNNVLDNVIGTCSGSNPGIQLLGGFGTERGGNTIQGNYIGTDKNGDALGATTNSAINIVADTSNNLIGGTANGDSNLIRGNGAGIVMIELEPIPSGQNNSFISNRIYENNGGGLSNLGIDLLESPDFGSSLVEESVTPNDANDSDSGSNDYLNFPVIDSVSASTGQFDVQFDLDVPDDAPNGYRIDFYANDTGDASGNGEGQYYLGSTNVAGSGNNQTATITIDPGLITTGTYDIAATTTERDNSDDGFGATSEFSAFLDNQSVIQPADNDNDGVNDSVENAGPNGGDGNGDGTADSEQESVATILDAESDDYITLELDSDGTCTQIEDFRSVLESELADQDPDYIYPLTLTEFVIPCADSVDGTIFWHGEEQFSDQVYRKYGPTTPGDSGTTSWYNSDFTLGATTVGGESVATASFNLTDGGLGDDTGDDDSIVDANGPGLPVSDSVADSVSNLLADTGFNIYLILLTATTLMFGSAMVLKRKHGNS